MRPHHILLCVALVVSGTAAQTSSVARPTFRLSGQVIDAETGSALPAAPVVILELKRGMTTDENGMFTFSALPKDRYHLQARFIGYRDDTVIVSLDRDQHVTLRLSAMSIELNEVRVTADREQEYLTQSSHSVAVLSSRDLEKTRGQTLGETLEKIPGVTVLQTGPSIAKPVIRGLHSQRVLVLNAGVPQEGQQWGGEHAPEIDPFSPAKIEVLKGPASVAYGSGAIGGVISVEPKQLPKKAGLGGQLTLNGFSNNRQLAGSLFLDGAHKALPGFAWRVQGSYRKAGNASAPTYVLGNTGFTEGNVSATAGFHTDDTGIEVLYSYFETELGIYKGSHIGSITDLERAIAAGGPLASYAFSYDIKPPKQNISHELWSIKAHHQFSGFGELEFQFGRQSNHRQEYDAYRFYNNMQQIPSRAAFDLTLTTYTAELKLKHNPMGDFFGTIGISAMRQGNVGAGTSFLIPNFRSYSGGVYALETWSPGDLILNAGIRFDYRWQRVYANPPYLAADDVATFTNVAGAVGITYQFAPSWSVNANLGTAFRPPSINELYSYGVHHGTAQFEIGDPSLLSERTYALDLTIKHQGTRSHAEISLYNNYMQHFIFLFPESQPVLTLRGAFPAFAYRQANSVLRGVDASFEYRLTGAYTPGVSLSIVRGDNLETHEPLYQMPADRLRLTNTLTLPSTSFVHDPYIELDAMLVRRQDRYPANVDYLDPPPGYATLDGEIGAQVVIGRQPVSVSLSVRNLLNTSYRDYLSRFRYYVDDPGRDIVLRMQIPFGLSE